MTNTQRETIKLEIGRHELRLKELVKNLKEYQIIVNIKEYTDIINNIKALKWLLDNETVIKEDLEKL